MVATPSKHSADIGYKTKEQTVPGDGRSGASTLPVESGQWDTAFTGHSPQAIPCRWREEGPKKDTCHFLPRTMSCEDVVPSNVATLWEDESKQGSHRDTSPEFRRHGVTVLD